MSVVVSGRHSEEEHRTEVLIEAEGRQVRFDVVEIPDGTYGYSRAERELAEPGMQSSRVGLWAQPASYRWLVALFARAGVGDAQVPRVLAAVRAGTGTREFRFVY
ncbi:MULTISPECIES: hypothetical protein [unclassified Nocardioides]|uniref:hypothetical protein n=1 Tax=unclassified Nocardioides TaxID=2615069 RepID=UPI00114E763A|nr:MULTISPECIES: hypothetical protein [unclassified Nocardioides]TQK72586.1 hypothetical protein FBY23_4402 [Nocardioides sp. SLBN-35]WGY03209.1 hypothetical protein QI633_05485 [Nocardioides sp. QY071]